MAKPKHKIQTDYLRIMAESFDICITAEAHKIRKNLGLSVIDVHDAVLDCMANWSNKTDTNGIFFDAAGAMEDGRILSLKIWVAPDFHCCRVEELKLVSGDTGDDTDMFHDKIANCNSKP